MWPPPPWCSICRPVFTVGFQIGEVLRRHMGVSARQARTRTLKLLAEVGIPDPGRKIDAFPSQMSGGQQQRVMIAMAIACEPKLLIADEPTTVLDVTIQKQITALIANLQKKHKIAVLFVTHDLGLVGEIADRVIVMRHGEIREQGAASDVFERPSDPYTRALLDCRPRIDQRALRLPVIDDYLSARAVPGGHQQPRSRGYSDADTPLLVVKKPEQKLFHARRPVRQARVQGRKRRLVHAPARQNARRGRGIRLRQNHSRPDAAAPAPGHRRQRMFEGRDLIAMLEREYHPYKRRIQIIFQNSYASLNARFSVGQILLEPMRIHQIGPSDGARAQLAMQLLDKVGLPAQAFHRYPHEFSGGQRQRVAIARCLTMKPDILVCDESVSALDVSVQAQAQVLNLLQDLQDEYAMSYIFISHDLSVVRYMADQVMVMHQGQVVEMADSDQLYCNPVHLYTRALPSAVPAPVGRPGLFL